MKHNINYYFLGLSVILIFFGISFLANLSATESLKIFGNTNYYILHQLYALAIGLVLGFAAFKIPLRLTKKIIPFVFIINLLLLVAVFIPFIGVKFGGARRWISIGGNTFQPSEFIKITAILYLSAWLSNRFSKVQKKGLSQRIKSSYFNLIHIFIPFLIFLLIISSILLFQRDLSTLGIIIACLLAIYFVAETPLWHTIIAIIGGIVGGLLFIGIEPYRVNRFLVFLNPETDPLGIGFQLRQSLLAIGSGGILGKGWGLSTQKFGFLPQAMSDSVFAVFAEETGIIGCIILISLFIILFWQGIKIAKNSSDKFSKMLAVGIMTWFIIQAFMNIASALGLFPLTGIPLPFFSYGGSHLVAEMIAIGLLLNISKNG